MPTDKRDTRNTDKNDDTDTQPQRIARAQIEWLRLLARSVVQLLSNQRKKTETRSSQLHETNIKF